MKTFICFLLLLLMSSSAFTQSKNDSTSIRLSSIDISSGKGAITSGLYVYVNFESNKTMLQATISENDLEITYFYRLFKDKLLVGPNVGYFYNVPYAGPIVIFSPVKFISTLHWYGWSAGKPGEKIEPNTSFLYGINAITLNAWRFNATYCLINYMNTKPQHTVSLKYSQPVNKNFSIYTDVGYDFLNQNQLLKIGINWKP